MTPVRLPLQLVLLVISVLPIAAVAGPPELSALFADAQFEQIRISPSGKFLAVKMRVEGREQLVVLDRKNMSASTMLAFKGNQIVNDFHWVKDDQLLVTNAVRHGWRDQPVYYGEIFHAAPDGSAFKPVFGFRAGEQQLGSFIRKVAPSRAWGYFLGDIDNDEQEVLVASYPWGNSGRLDESWPSVYRMNIRDGRLRHVATGPRPGALFITTRNGDVRFATAVDDDGAMAVYEYSGESAGWQRLARNFLGATMIDPVSIALDGSAYYYLSDAGAPTTGLYEMDSNESRLLVRDERFDISRVYLDPVSDVPLWVEFDDPREPLVDYIDADNTLSMLHRELSAAFKGMRVTFTSITGDAGEIIVLVDSDRDPGAFYILDIESRKAEFLASKFADVDPDQLVPMRPVEIEARDGLKLYGMLTSSSVSQPPMVVLVHGGPHARDVRQFDPVVQALATRGYAVLQINFRGSTGFGSAFEAAGRGEWGGVMQDDVTDATRWAIENGHADAERICIMGESYGGYAAMMGLVRESSLYRCGVSVSGVSSLELMFEEGDVPDARWGRAYLEDVLGTDKARWRERSPANVAERIQAPVLLVHGGKDERVPIEHAKLLERALRSAGKKVETHFVDSEAHGFMSAENRVAAYSRILQFIERQLVKTGDKDE